MKNIPVGSTFAHVSDDDFERLSKYKWQLEQRSHTQYAVRSTTKGGKSIKIYMHREVLGLTHSGQLADHINHNGLDNRRENLRPCTIGQNNAHIRTRIRPELPFRGVYANRHSFRARIRQNGRTVGLGRFTTAEAAARAYDQKALELFGAFAITNFPQEAA